MRRLALLPLSAILVACAPESPAASFPWELDCGPLADSACAAHSEMADETISRRFPNASIRTVRFTDAADSYVVVFGDGTAISVTP